MHALAGLPDSILASLAAVPLQDAALAAVALFLIRLSSHLGMWTYAIVALPGTLAHEMAHYLVALVLGARPSFPSLVPQRTTFGWRLGSVAFRAGPLRSLPIALAPLMLLPLAAWWLLQLMVGSPWPLHSAHAWIVGALVSACLPSAADMRIALPALAVIALLLLAWWLLH
jgi:hypothetical protein